MNTPEEQDLRRYSLERAIEIIKLNPNNTSSVTAIATKVYEYIKHENDIITEN